MVGSRRLFAEDYFPLDELALQVCCDKIDTADIALIPRSVREETARRSMSEGFGEGLVIVHSLFQRAALHAQSRLGCAIALFLEHPYEFVDSAAARHVRLVDQMPRIVGAMVAEFLIDCRRPRCAS